MLADPNISRQHLVVWSTPRGAFLRDLGSQNGTYIAGRRVGAEAVIQLNNEVADGQTRKIA